jgi:hypothetical protein
MVASCSFEWQILSFAANGVDLDVECFWCQQPAISITFKVHPGDEIVERGGWPREVFINIQQLTEIVPCFSLVIADQMNENLPYNRQLLLG